MENGHAAMVPIKRALISTFRKEGLNELVEWLQKYEVDIVSTGGTAKAIEKLGAQVTHVEDLTGYPSILGGRVKTLHPAVFGGILNRKNHAEDDAELANHAISSFDLVVVDLYPFEKTIDEGGDFKAAIEMIDIGGIALIRATAKNHESTTILSDESEYSKLIGELKHHDGHTCAKFRKKQAVKAFRRSSSYDQMIANYLLNGKISKSESLRYGENPHQSATFTPGNQEPIKQIHGKALSYNNIVDVDAALQLINEFAKQTVAIIKHTNPCGLASRSNQLNAFKTALAGDPMSAFGGIIAFNRQLEAEAATEIKGIFCEVVMAPSFSDAALELLRAKKKLILLEIDTSFNAGEVSKSVLGGTLSQEADSLFAEAENLTWATQLKPSEQQMEDLAFAEIAVKHLKSNAIALVKDKQLLGKGCGQTSRVDALEQAIAKAKQSGLDLTGAVMASDAFFPFDDCVALAKEAGIASVIQPGGSIRDKESVEYCDKNGLSMIFTGIRHFRH